MHLFFLSDILKELNRLTWLQWGWDHNNIRSRTYSDFSKFHLVPLLKYQMVTCQKKMCRSMLWAPFKCCLINYWAANKTTVKVSWWDLQTDAGAQLKEDWNDWTLLELLISYVFFKMIDLSVSINVNGTNGCCDNWYYFLKLFWNSSCGNGMTFPVKYKLFNQ